MEITMETQRQTEATNADGGKSLSNALLVRVERVNAVNKMIKAIADCGRRFFYYKDKDRYAQIEMDSRGRIWWIDDYTNERIYTHYKYDWQGFSHGGTMRGLVEAFRDHITKGTPVPSRAFGPWPEWYCGGDLWGYGDDIKKVRDAALKLGIIEH
jgi:hypothetical protein